MMFPRFLLCIVLHCSGNCVVCSNYIQCNYAYTIEMADTSEGEEPQHGINIIL